MLMASINPESPPMVLEFQNDSYANTKKPANYMALLNVLLRVLLFVTTLISVVALAAGKQTETIAIPLFPPYKVSVSAKFNDSPAFIYSLAALSVACLYSVITTLLSFFALMKRGGKLTKLMSNVFVIDVLLLGIVASATGTAAELGYIGLKGNSKMGSHKICNVYGSYCRHIGTHVLSSVFASILLCFLIVLRIKTL